MIANGHDPFGKGPQFISFNNGDEGITIQINGRDHPDAFAETVTRINEVIEGAFEARPKTVRQNFHVFKRKQE